MPQLCDKKILVELRTMPTLHIKTLKCNRQEDWTGDDDIFIRVDGNRHNMGKFDDDESKKYNDKNFSFVSEIVIELWERDTTDPNDKIGTRKITASDAGLGKKEVNFSGSGASYDMWYVVEP
jgi:hypothetical protein